MERAIENVKMDYQAAVEEAAYRIVLKGGYLRFSGDDRVDFVQRQSTNDMTRLEPGRTITTVLTDPTARILDVLEIFARDDETLDAITLPGNGTTTAKLLKGKIFFNDKVTVEDQSGEIIQIEVQGPKAGEILNNSGIASLPGIGEIIEAKIRGAEIRVAGREGLTAEEGFLLLAAQQSKDEVIAALEENGIAELSDETHEILRVEAMMPIAGHELTADYTPLESGLASAISDDKGCYTGQEVIARQITYDKITKSLVLLTTEEETAPGDVVRVEDKKAGEVTSSAISPRHGPIALAILKRPYNQEGAAVTIERGDKVIKGRVETVK